MLKTAPVDPVMRIPDVSVDVDCLVQRGIDRFDKFALDRIEWMRRREEYYLGWDDYISPVRKGLWEGSSNFHLPVTEVKANQMHALIMQAILFNYPWFYVDPQEDVDVSRIKKAERFMKYILERYCNYNKGIYLAIDDWAWDLVTEGMGVLSRQWVTQQRRLVSVEENPGYKQQRIDLQKMLDDTEEKEFDRLANQIIKQPYMEKAIIRTVFNGPVVIAEDPAMILFKGEVVDSTDLNEHETVIKVCTFDDATLQGFADSQYFDEDAVEKVLASDSDRKWTSTSMWGNDRTRRARDVQTGVNTVNPMMADRTYEFLCVYDRCKLNPSAKKSTADRLQYFIHPKTRQLMRWTYLDRISSNGKLPLHMAHLFRRPRRAYGRGMVASMHNINEVQDILVNHAIDAGMLANNPMFAYRGGSTFDPQEIRVEPGLGVKTDDPMNDLRFFTFSVNPNWALPLENIIQSTTEQLFALGPQQSGQIGPTVGPLRSGAGVQAMGANASTQQNVIINRAKIPISECFEGLYSDCVDKMDKRMKITVTGADGVPLFGDDGAPVTEDVTQEDLRMRLHFGIFANSQNMNHEIQKANAMAIAQFSFQPVLLQTGVIQPQNIYEIMANIHQTLGTLRPDRFISKPKGAGILPLEWELKMIMSGQMPPVELNDPDHEGKLEILEPLLNSPEADQEVQFGKVHPSAMNILKVVVALHKKFAAVVAKPSTVENPMGNNQSPTLGAMTGREAPPQIQQPNQEPAQPRQAPQGQPQGQPQQGPQEG